MHNSNVLGDPTVHNLCSTRFTILPTAFDISTAARRTIDIWMVGLQMLPNSGDAGFNEMLAFP